MTSARPGTLMLASHGVLLKLMKRAMWWTMLGETVWRAVQEQVLGHASGSMLLLIWALSRVRV